MSVYNVQNMILVSGIIAWILLIAVLVFKKENYPQTWGNCTTSNGPGQWSHYYPGSSTYYDAVCIQTEAEYDANNQPSGTLFGIN